MNTETHPLQPFLPANAKILMLGSFPPQRKRWSMEWFYPNIQNDMWRIFGLIFFHNKDYFYDSSLKAFKLDILRPFMEEKGIAIYDTATEVRRLKNNASDAFLEVVRQTDIKALIAQLPLCTAIIATGQKAADILAEQYQCSTLKIGVPLAVSNNLTLYRMPSSSRSYPLALEKKADFYRSVFVKENIEGVR
jgi:G:T/U-mismatch repair DNA glycosylase